jgi:hypothetical protein
MRRRSRARRVIPPLLAGSALALIAPGVVLGHALNPTYESQLPLVVYLTGAGLAVALSFAFVLLQDLRFDPPPPPAPFELGQPVRLALRVIGFIAWLWILIQGLAGGSSDADVATLFIWVYTWVGVALISAFLGPIWFWLDPFSTLHDIGAWVLRRIGFEGWDPAEYPKWLGHWPALVGFVFVVWLELVLKGAVGRTLFVAFVGYSALTLAMMAQFGRDTWRTNGETFGVWFRLIGRLALFALVDETGRLRRRPFPTGLLEPGWRREDVVLIAIGTGSILFDGLSQTTPWFEVFGAPAAPVATLQLFAFLGLIVAASLAVTGFVGMPGTGAGLLPIAVGYLLAHYLTYLFTDGQRIVIAVSDPLQQGADLFGTAFYQPSAYFLQPGLVWTIQLMSVVGGHMVGAWAGHIASTQASGRDVRVRQVPLAAVMVFLTTLTLWSLGQAIVKSPATTGSTTMASGASSRTASAGTATALASAPR